jgi:hypothetical protein
MPNNFFLYEQKSNVQHLIEISLKISTNKLQERIESDCYQTTRPYPLLQKPISIIFPTENRNDGRQLKKLIYTVILYFPLAVPFILKI